MPEPFLPGAPGAVGQPRRVVRSAARDYAAAFAALAAAVLLRALLDPLMGDRFPFIILFGAVAAAFWAGGYRPALVVAIVGYLVCDYLFVSPRGSFGSFLAPGRLITVPAYLISAAFIVLFGERTRRAQVHADLRREELRVTLRSIGDAIITTDLKGRVVFMNPVAESLTGWTQQAAEGQLLDDVFRIVNEDTGRPVASPVEKVLREGIVVGLANHTALLHKEGRACPIDDSAAPIRDDQGRVSGCVLTFRDVTERRRVERERADQLRTSQLLASIIESSSDAIIGKSLE